METFGGEREMLCLLVVPNFNCRETKSPLFSQGATTLLTWGLGILSPQLHVIAKCAGEPRSGKRSC